MKNFTSFLLSLTLSFSLFGQTAPTLSDSDMIQKSELNKKAGWMKIKLDEDFKEASSDATAKYEYYEFCAKFGYYYFSEDMPFPGKNDRVIYKKTDPSANSNLLNGILDCYNKKNHLIHKLVFKEGFLIAEYDYNWKKYTGSLKFALEFIPDKKGIDTYYNGYNKSGDYINGFHGKIGNKFVSLEGEKNIVPKQAEIAEGWQRSGERSYDYDMFIDSSAHNGQKAASIRSIDKKTDAWGTLLQRCEADKFRGKRIRMSGFMKTENVTGWAGFWLRIDQPGTKQYLSFDNMSKRSIKGTTPWTKYEIILDVPQNATLLNFGALLCYGGQIWFDDITFEIVDGSVPITGDNYSARSSPLSSEPINLNFEK